MTSPHILQTIHPARVYGGFRLYHLRLPQHNGIILQIVM
ncbi:unnamed protein product [Brugia pahangi]|uniref:Uncharacterized protein n=1 Tax=Brugia pahangi TaxID=6280 RepID=A0A0N4T4N4_BRUPA|nr:unnamed protein product [Brugia pahangi]